MAMYDVPDFVRKDGDDFILVFNEFRLRHMISQRDKQIGKLDRELAALRNLPLEEDTNPPDEPDIKPMNV